MAHTASDHRESNRFVPATQEGARLSGEGGALQNSSSSTATRVLLIGLESAFAANCAETIGGEMGMSVCGQAGSADEAFAVLAEAEADVAVVDISLADAHGLDLVQNLQAQYPEVEVVIFSMYDERVYAERAVRAGAAGYVMKAEPTARLVEAIRTVARGEVYLSRRATSVLLSNLVRSKRRGRHAPASSLRFDVDTLTGREMDVLRQVGRGQTTAQVARELDLNEKMINVYQRRIRRKLGIETLNALRQFAVQWVMATDHIG